MDSATRKLNDGSNGLGVLNNKLNDMRTLLESERCETNTLRLKVQQEKEMREQIMERLKMMELQMYNNHQKSDGGNHSTLKQHNATTATFDEIGNAYCLDHTRSNEAKIARKKKKKVAARKKKKKRPKKRAKTPSTEMIKLHIPKTTARVLLAYRENLC